MYRIVAHKFVGPEKGRLFNRAFTSSFSCFPADQVFFMAVQLVWLAGEAVLRAPVRTAAYGANDDRAIVSARLLESCCCFVTSETKQNKNVSTWNVPRCYKQWAKLYLVICQLIVSSAKEALKTEPQSVQLKNLHC